jgi:hypothetical protein
MLVVTNELAGRTELEAIGEVVSELGGEPDVEVATCHQESDLDTMLDRRAGRTVVVVGGPGAPSLSSAGRAHRRCRRRLRLAAHAAEASVAAR